MSRMKMTSVKDHPARDALRLDYDRTPAHGDYIARLDHHAWGDHANLFSYFSDVETGYRFRLSTWQNRDYRPAGEGPAFDEEPVGGVFTLVVGATRNGLAKLMSATCIKKVPDELAYPQTLEAHYERQCIAMGQGTGDIGLLGRSADEEKTPRIGLTPPEGAEGKISSTPRGASRRSLEVLAAVQSITDGPEI